jgi:PAS domain S-box-containing protein
MNNTDPPQPPASDLLSEVQFSDIFHIEEIQRLQDLFSDATGVASIITHPDGTPITLPSNFCRLCREIIRGTKIGRENCFKSDAAIGRKNADGPNVQPCLSGGLWDAGASITVGGKHIANWLIGQVQNKVLDENRMIQYADEIGADRTDFIQALKEVPVMSLEQFNKVANMLYAFANELSEKAYNNLKLRMQHAENEKAAAALRQSEVFNRRIVETANEGIWAMDDDYNTTFVNRKMAEILGYTVAEIMERKFFEFLFPEDREDHKQRRLERMSGKSDYYERRFKRKDGSGVWTLVSATAILDENGGFLGSFGMILDITERKKSEETISMLAHAIRSISECVSITDMADQTIFVNNAFLRTYQYEEEELIGKSIRVVRSQKNRPEIESEVLPATLGGGWQGELINRRKDGSEFPVFVSTSVVHGDKDEPIALIGIARDITEQKQAEEMIRKLNNDLDHRVKQRTAELEAANKELESFSYSVSHDLKAPLRHIMAFLNLFLESMSTQLNKQEVGYLNMVSGSAREMQKLIDAILSFSKLNQASLRKTNINSDSMVQQVIDFFDMDRISRIIHFNIETLPDVSGDERLIRQVWTNLISNAVKYTGRKQEAVIEIGSCQTDVDTTFFIRDNGTGFDMEYAGKLFGVFQRLHSAKEFEGVGIGLANVHRIITRHGGQCRAEGKINEGATFYFSLPL